MFTLCFSLLIIFYLYLNRLQMPTEWKNRKFFPFIAFTFFFHNIYPLNKKRILSLILHRQAHI